MIQENENNMTVTSPTHTTVLAAWLEGELHATRRVLERAITRAEALAGLLAFVRDAEVELGEPIGPGDMQDAALAVGGERRRAEVAALIDAMGDPLTD
ncbi:hypothetical protein [Nocardioides piscis]|uniref:Uncharacterized protein n=1 Tax=Nocardioides piscis TaxID=2714938 RepID=A0A6G7YGW8_9ACTN|nr:hypothetical protein [Nocardioides piscis]QIK76043.1 hypothetical protein G7071_11965 [Nocardioides piscis]